jgi:putative transposase
MNAASPYIPPYTGGLGGGGIRERSHRPPRSKTERRRSNSWAFYQLRQFVHYKAARAGIQVVVVPPAYSSQTCHQCFWIEQREGKHFRCVNPLCGWEGDADFNGANGIALLGVAVNQPPLHPPACGGTRGGPVVGLPTAGLPKARFVPPSIPPPPCPRIRGLGAGRGAVGAG